MEQPKDSNLAKDEQTEDMKKKMTVLKNKLQEVSERKEAQSVELDRLKLKMHTITQDIEILKRADLDQGGLEEKKRKIAELRLEKDSLLKELDGVKDQVSTLMSEMEEVKAPKTDGQKRAIEKMAEQVNLLMNVRGAEKAGGGSSLSNLKIRVDSLTEKMQEK